MNHGYFQDRLSAYFDQALTLEEMRAVEEHLADCAECRSQLDDLAKLDQLIEDKRDLGESDYWEKAAQKIEQRIGSVDDEKITDARSGWFGLGWKLVAAAASVAALTFVALHEGEIQDISVKPDRSADVAIAPPTTDSGSGQIFDLEDFKAELRSAQDSHAETAVRKASPEPGAKKEGPATSASDNAAGKFELDESPIETVDELLESVAGVVTNASGEIFIRGGRAGETDYVVDGVPTEVTEEEVTVDMGKIALTKKTTDIGKTITVRAEVDIIDKFETTHRATITKEQLPTTIDTPTLDDLRAKFQYLATDTSMKSRIMRQPVTSVEELLEQVEGVVTNKDGEIFIRGGRAGEVKYIVDGVPHSGVLGGLGEAGANLSFPPRPADSLDSEQKLAWWRTRRDSLKQQLDSAPGVSTRNRSFKNMGAKERAEVDPLGLEKDRIASRFLKACFNVALLTDSEDEYDDAWFAIAKYADDDDSALQEGARHDLQRLALIARQRQDQE